ncbi:hypothetical protein [Microlunatus parietis]|uniref:Nucleotidyltransferase n=1 Tax=Microlunatus parietis TaxID=682979 RepID=A0A7Y9LCE8_9ACTN|nr:hypothetical protein [Microlunatus parietis]NYE70831.1 hypothetical protein [Microlunatus parietis]
MTPYQLLERAVRRTAEAVRGRTPTGRTHDDADDVVGTLATDGALDYDPRPLLASLHRAGAPVVIIGQVAGILHGSAELTGDLDLLWDGDPRHAPALAAGFATADAELADDDGRQVPCGPESFLLPKVTFEAPGATGDACTPALPWGSLRVADYLGRALRLESPDGWSVGYLRADDLIAMRRAVGRPKDLRRAAELEALLAEAR